MTLPEHAARRRGATTVETAMVMLPLMLFMFSIFEYGRFVMLRQMMDLAAEVGCRGVVVNNTSATVTADTTTIVHNLMAGMDSTTHFAAPGVTTTVWTVDSTGANVASDTASINAVQPGSPIAVSVSGNFLPMFPTLLFVPFQVPMSSKVILTCEGN